MLPTGAVPNTASLELRKSNGRRHPNWAPGFAPLLTPVIKADAREAREQNRQLNNRVGTWPLVRAKDCASNVTPFPSICPEWVLPERNVNLTTVPDKVLQRHWGSVCVTVVPGACLRGLLS